MTLKRTFIILVTGALFITLTSFVLNGRHGSNGMAEETVGLFDDSVVSVIAWFDNRDTMTYWINDSEWSIDGGDTVKTFGVYTRFMIAVTDSTRKGYGMECKFLDVAVDTTVKTGKHKLMEIAADKLRESMTGTIIKFRINEVGEIVKYDNLKEIKTQARNVLSEIFYTLPYIDSLKSAGVKTDRLLKLVDADLLVDGYVEELEMLFQWHGRQYKTGEYTTHEDSTATQYESDTYMEIWQDPESYEYGIVVDMDDYIPKKDLNDIIGVLADMFLEKEDADKAKAEMESVIEEVIKEDVVVRSFSQYHKYFPDGWPEEVICQEKAVMGDKGKLIQKCIIWDYRSICNY